MPPASAMCIRSSIVTDAARTRRRTDPSRPAARVPRCRGCHRQNRCACRCARPQSRDRREHGVLQPADVERSRRIPVRRRRRQLDRVPATLQIQAGLRPCASGVADPLSRTVTRAASPPETARRPAVEILDDAVVGKDLHLVVGKGHGEHTIVLARAASASARRVRAALAAR